MLPASYRLFGQFKCPKNRDYPNCEYANPLAGPRRNAGASHPESGFTPFVWAFGNFVGTQIADKTDWRKLLKGEAEPLNLIEQRDQILEEFAPKIQTIRDEFSQNLEFNENLEFLENELPREFIYPVEQYPEKIKSLNLDKTPKIRGVLQGIKGQYLLLDIGVINIRKYTGYELILRA